ncbi:MAG: ATP-dependent sacrificial sulfur transferase LarE [Clostridia bacterium]|nr:ATP-dependent sacrificial sulfur transferase LarE [Clostridia bacterium]
MTTEEKYQRLLADLSALGSVAVSFSGGVDSTFLLWAAREALGDRVLAVTAASCSFPRRELDEAKRFCLEKGIEQVIVRSEELEIEGFRNNPPDRCYLCKKELFGKILTIARERGMAAVAEGSNLDDEGDYRPGLRAIRELGVESPLKKAGLTKAEIRDLSRQADLPTWDKPSFACLASRFPYGESITAEKLAMVDKAEQAVLDRGFSQVRVRIHGNVARIEVPAEDLDRLMAARGEIAAAVHAAGFAYAALDLDGYRTGSMNEVLHG